MNGETIAASAHETAPSAVNDYVLCGWRVRSAVPLPEAMPWIGDGRSPDVRIRFGAAPALVDPVLHGSGPVQVGADGVCRFGIKQVASFLVVGGSEVIVEPHGPLDAPEFRAWLLGPVLGMLCHQRGLFPLHAACLRLGTGAVALTGRTGTGKSTLAAALVRRGHALLADDISVIDPTAHDGPRVLPSFPRLKLWDDVLQSLNVPLDGMPRANSGKRKFHFYQAGSFDPSDVRLRAIYVLNRPTASEGHDIRPISGPDTAAMLSREIYRRPIGFALGRKVALLTETLRIAAAVPIFRLPLRHDLSSLDAAAARVETHFSAHNGDRRTS
jgi:hypothetical protein